MKTDKPDELHETTARLGTERLSKLLFRLSAPNVASMITISLYHLVDTFWLGQLSYQAIAAVTIAVPFYWIVVAIGDGTGVGANALASRRFGEKNIEATNQVAGQIFPLSAVFGVVITIVSVCFARQVATLLGATSDIVDMTADYLVFIGWGMPFFLFRHMSSNIFHAAGDAIKPMIFTIVGAVANAILDPFFIFGWGPFPEMGVGGAGLATTISGGIAAVLSYYFLVGGRSAYRLNLHHVRPNLPIIAQIYRVGLPSILMEMTVTIVFILFHRIVAGFGSIALAAVGIGIRVIDLAFMPIYGVAKGLLPIVGFCLGARLWKRLWSAVKQASLNLVVMLGIATVLLVIFAPQLIAIFNDDPELLAIAVPGLRIMISTLVLIGLSIMFTTTFQGLSKGWTAISLSLVRELVFFIPAIFILPRFFGLNGVWLSLPIADVCGTIIAGFWLYREYRLQKRSGIWHNAPVTKPIPKSIPRGRSMLD
jgi:putative MATE family efflux protein